ncbi:MAG: ribonuclease III [Simkaniaceae bacterium]|nr:ribonuclease III [Simkaniaceae bacterium]
MSVQVVAIEKRIGYSFTDPTLLEQAFVHRSFINECAGLQSRHNERLEFLGDAVLGLVVSHYLFETFPDMPEGELSYLRSCLVEGMACATYAEKIGLSDYLLLGKGEVMSGGKKRKSILADLFEALAGAIYLDGGLSVFRNFFLTTFREEIEKTLARPARNWKADLQDYCQKHYRTPPVYEVMAARGPDHAKEFEVVVTLEGRILGRGTGPSKKVAEQRGAEEAMKKEGGS